MNDAQDIRFAYFGTGRIALLALEELHAAGLVPVVIVTAPDRPQGRGLALTPSLVGSWAQEHGIETLKPEKLDGSFVSQMQAYGCDVFIVADYGHIIPQTVLDIPRRGTLNVHPSLLPRLRGPSPIRSAILEESTETGVTIMLLDDKMDHGPIISQKKVDVVWPPHASELEEVLARTGGRLLAQVLPLWISGEAEAHEQNHDLATYTKKLEKTDGLLDLSDNPEQVLRKIRALEGWPGTYTFFERSGKQLRVAILDAHLDNGSLVIDSVKPEGKQAMAYADFVRSGAKPLTSADLNVL